MFLKSYVEFKDSTYDFKNMFAENVREFKVFEYQSFIYRKIYQTEQNKYRNMKMDSTKRSFKFYCLLSGALNINIEAFERWKGSDKILIFFKLHKYHYTY